MNDNTSTIEKLNRLVASNPSNEEWFLFFTNLHAFHRSGMGLSIALDTIAAESTNLKLKECLFSMAVMIKDEGIQLAEAMERQKIFPTLAVFTIRAGEKSGNLEKAMEELTQQIERQGNITQKIKTALLPVYISYAFLSIAAVIVFAFLIPKFQVIYKERNMDLPAFTKMTFAVLDFIKNQWYIIALIAIAIGCAIYYIKKHKQHWLDKLWLKTPVIKSLVYYQLQYRISTNFAMFAASNSNHIDTLEELASISGNTIAADALRKTAIKIMNGNSLSSSMKENNEEKIFDYILMNMVRSGEDNGSLPYQLGIAAEVYRKKVLAIIENFGTKITTVTLIPIAIVFVFIMVSLYYPMLMISQVKH